MNPLHEQGQHSLHGNDYGYGSQQDDFSTDFTSASNPTFSDTNNLFNQNFHSSFLQSIDDNDTTMQDHHQQATDFLQPQQLAAPQSWQSTPLNSYSTSYPTFSRSSSYSYQNPTSYQTSTFNSSYSNPLNTPSYGTVGNSSFSYGNQPYAFQAPQEEPQQQTIAPSAIETPADLWQQPINVNDDESNDEDGINLSQASDAVTSAPTTAQTELTKRELEKELEELHMRKIFQKVKQGVPQERPDGAFTVRDVEQYSSHAAARKLGRPFLFISQEQFAIGEPRPQVQDPVERLSTKKIRAKLNAYKPAEKEALERKKLVQAKLDKQAKKNRKSKAKTIGPKIPKVKKTPGAGTVIGTQVKEVIEESSDEESSASASDDDSEYASDSEDDHIDEPSPLPSSRPTDAAKAMEYDILKTVWAPARVKIEPDGVRARLGAYLELMRKIRADWKTASTAQADAQTKGDNGEGDKQGKIAAEYKQQFEQALRLTVKHSHSNFIESLDQLKPFATTLGACLNELLKANSYNDTLINAILQVAVKIPSVDPEFLATAKLDKYAPKIAKRAGSQVTKDLALLVVEQASKPQNSTKAAPELTGKPKSAADKALNTSSMMSALKATSMPGKNPSEVQTTAAKKPTVPLGEQKRSTDSAANQKKAPISAVSKQAPPSTRPTTASGAAATLSKQVAAAKAGEKVTPAISTGPAVKQVIRQVVPKAPSIYASLQSASKKPGIVTAPAKPALSALQKTTKPEVKAAPATAPTPIPAAPKPTFSFADTLANLGKPKEEPKKADKKENQPPETEEERKKRLRKEERRKLRVTWKPESDLVQVRIFDHKLEDEMNHEAAEVADVTDLKSEGKNFKLRYQEMLAEQEEDEEQEFMAWKVPQSTDFSSIEERQLMDNYETRARGKKVVDSPEARAQQQREQNVMMSFYSTMRDVPSTPREPPDPFNGQAKSQYDFGAPPQIIQGRSQNYFSVKNAGQGNAPTNVSEILKMLGQNQQPQQTFQQPQQQYGMAPATPDLHSILAQLSGVTQQPALAPVPATAPQSGDNSYQAAIDLFLSMQSQGRNQGTSAPPAPMPAMQQHQQPQPQPALTGAPDLSSLLASLNAASQPQQQAPTQAPMQVPMQQQQSQQQSHLGTIPGVSPDIMQFLANYNAQNQGGPQLQPPTQAMTWGMPQMQQQQQQQQQQKQQNWGGYGGYGQPVGQQQQQQAAPMYAGIDGGAGWGQQGGTGSNERKRGFEEDDRNGGGKKKKPFYGVPKVPCRYYKEGKCFKGANCTFLHE